MFAVLRDSVESTTIPFIVHIDQSEVKNNKSDSEKYLSEDITVKLSSYFVEDLQNPHTGPEFF